MKKSKFTPEQMCKILKEFDQGKKVEEITRKRHQPGSILQVATTLWRFRGQRIETYKATGRRKCQA
jgi:hypothetical protein